MSIIVSDVAKGNLANMIFAPVTTTWSSYSAQIHLYTSNFSLTSAGPSLATLQAAEAGFGGYSYVSLTSPTPNGIVSGDYYQYTFTPVSFTVSSTGGSEVCYGYWVDALNASSVRVLLWAEAFASPYGMSVLGQQIAWTPQFSLGQGS